jgi:hypothetical protein
MSDALKSLAFALEKYPEQLEVVPLADLVTDSARENPRRPAYVKLSVPDDVVKSIRGGASDSDILLLVRLPREILQRSESRIVLPSETR